MLAQTNLQLYRQLIAVGWNDDALARVRDGYEFAAALVAGCLRPSGKPFLCHLVGTASALARWGERPEMVLAGLLHSAYFLGEFGDGERGATPRRRDYTESVVGAEAEALLHRYAANKKLPIDRLDDRDVLVMELADLLDELMDAGPAYQPDKPLVRLSGPDRNTPNKLAGVIAALAARVIGPAAADDLRHALADWEQAAIPDCLLSDRPSSYRVPPGVEPLRRGAAHRRLLKLHSKLLRKRAA